MATDGRSRDLVRLGLAVTLGACACSAGVDGDGSGDRIGSVTLALQRVPTSVLCVVIDAASADYGTSRQFSVVGGSTNTTLDMGKLALGSTTLEGLAYDQACASIASATPSWIADPVTVVLEPGVRAAVDLTFRKNNSVVGTASFVDNITSVTVGYWGSVALTDPASSGDVPSIWGFVAGVSAGSQVPTAGGPLTPQSASVLQGASKVAIGLDHVCGIFAGQVRCFGKNGSGQLGNGTTSSALTSAPGTPVAGVSEAVSIAAGGSFSCASTRAGSVYCWGLNNEGQLGDGTQTNRTTPVVSSISGATAVYAGERHACAAQRSGSAMCWGYNGFGQLGLNDTTRRLVPTNVAIPGSEPVADMALGANFSCERGVNGVVRCWGNNAAGQLGTGTTTQSLVPALVSPPSGLDALEITAGADTACALSSAGAVSCWGANSYGTLGNEGRSNRTTPGLVVGLPAAVDHLGIMQSSYGATACAFVLGGDAWCWGRNDYGQVGDGTLANRFVATQVEL